MLVGLFRERERYLVFRLFRVLRRGGEEKQTAESKRVVIAWWGKIHPRSCVGKPSDIMELEG
jgi:hypothetical protein